MRALVLVVLAACGGGDSLVVVLVDSSRPLTGVERFQVRETAGGSSMDHTVAPGGVFDIPPPRSFGVLVPESIGGKLALHVEAVDPGGRVLGAGDGEAPLHPGGRSDVLINLSPASDGGVVDLAIKGDLAFSVPDGGYRLGGTVESLGEARRAGSLVLSEQRLEGFPPVCAGAFCVTGGVTP